MNIRLITLAIVALSTFCLSAEISAPQNSPRGASVDDFMPHPNSAEKYNETWSYQFVFDNGTRAFVNYSTLHVPTQGRKITCDLSFQNFKGKNYTVGRQYPPERLVANKGAATLDIKGEYKMEKKPGKGHHVYFTADKNGKFMVDVTFDSAEEGKVLGNGTWKIGKQNFAQYIHIPYGRVSGKIAYNSDTIAVKGYAYMDQTWQNEQATDVAIRSISFSTNESKPMYAGRISLTPDGKPLGYAIYNGPEGVKVVTPAAVKDGSSAYNGKKFPTGKLSIEWNDASVPALQFDVSKPLQKASILDKFDGFVERNAFKIAAGEVLFYRGRSDGSNGKKIDWVITGKKD